MSREVKLSRVRNELDELDYPVERSAAAAAVDDVTLLLADGEVNFAAVVRDTASDTFESAADLEAELHNALPRAAVGEPFQSEGEG
ncbi:hypothetical protein DVK02_11500 [Halobellus sp. Atlit-31R]|nr:hypothetical protein DVK02_11500 [Halobellus sp. Atlit-31R]